MYAIQDLRIDIQFQGLGHKYRADKHYRTESRAANAFIYYIKGGHRFDYPDFTFECEKGDFIFLPVGSCYTNHVLTDEIEYIQIDFLLYKNGKPEPLFDKPIKMKEELASKAQSYIREACERYLDRGKESVYFLIGNISILIDLFMQSAKPPKQPLPEYERIAESVRYIKSNFDKEFTVAELATMSSTCVSNFEKLFRKCFGMGAVSYRNKLRIERSKQFLAGGHSVAEASAAVGFSDTFYFSKMFKKYVGTTPGEFKKQYRGV